MLSEKDRLREFGGVIASLSPFAKHSKLDMIIQRAMPSASMVDRFFVKREIKRRAKPCLKPLDLRSIYPIADKFTFCGLEHYLDDSAKQVFLTSVARYKGIYTIGTFDAVINHVKNQKGEGDNVERVDNDIRSLLRHIPLKSQTKPVHEEVVVRSDISINISGHPSEDVFQMIDASGKLIIIETKSPCLHEQTLPVEIEIHGHQGGIKFSSSIFLTANVQSYKEFSRANEQRVRYYLVINKAHTDEYQLDLYKQYLVDFERARRQSMLRLVEPLKGNILAKGYEQIATSNDSDVMILMSKQGDVYRPSIALRSPRSMPLISKLGLGKNTDFSSLLERPTIQGNIENRVAFKLIGVWVKGEENYWFSLSQCTIPAIQKFIFEQDKSNVTFLSIVGKPISPLETHTHRPSVPVSFREDFNISDVCLEPKVQELLTRSNYQITISDHANLQPYLNRVRSSLNKGSELCHRGGLITRVRMDDGAGLLFINDKNDDIRHEDRYVHHFPILVTAYGKINRKTQGVTVNISRRGLCIAVDNGDIIKVGDEIDLTINMKSVGGRVVENQPYLVLGKLPDGTFRLVISKSEKSHKSAKMLKRFIQRDRLKLTPTKGTSKEEAQLLSSMRSIRASNSDGMYLYITQNKTDSFISSYTLPELCPQFVPPIPGNTQTKCVDQMLSNDAFRAIYKKMIPKMNEKCSTQTTYIIVVPIKNKEGHAYYIASIDDVMNNRRHSQFFYDVLCKEYEMSVYQLKLSYTLPLNTKFIRDEMELLLSISQSEGDRINQELREVDIVGFLTDVTQNAVPLLLSSVNAG